MLTPSCLVFATLALSTPLEPIEAERAAQAAATQPSSPASSPSLTGSWPGGEKKVSLDLDRVSTREALKKLAAAAGWSIAFADSPAGQTDASFNDVPADQVLAVLLRAEGLVARREGDLITIERPSSAAAPAAPSVPAVPQVPAAPAAPAPSPGSSASPGHDQVVFGRSAQVAAGETVRSAVVVGGNLDVQGEVTKDAVAVGGNLDVQGTVGHDVVTVGGTITLGPKAVVNGSVVTIGGSLKADPSAVVRGDRSNVFPSFSFGPAGHPAPPEPEASFLHRVAWSAARWAVLFVLGLLMLAFWPRRLESIARELGRAPGPSGLIGALGAIAVPVLLVLLVITVVGILAIPFLMFFLMLALLAGFVSLAFAVGQKVPGKAGRRSQVATLALGTLALFLVSQVPFLGALVMVLASMVVFGAVLRTRFGSLSPNDASFIPQP